MDDTCSTNEADSLNVEVNVELEKQKFQLLAQLDEVLGLPPPSSCDIVLAEEEDQSAQQLVKLKLERSSGSNSKNELFDEKERSLEISSSMIPGEKLQKGVGNSSSLKAAETSPSKVTYLEYDKGRNTGIEIEAGNEEAVQEEEGYSHQPLMTYNFTSPMMALNYEEEFSIPEDNFTKGCKWSPDGSCLLVGSDDKKLRLLNLPTPVIQGDFQRESWFMGECEQYSKAAITIQEKELLYDYTWYPLMQSSDSRTCCFASTCRDQPVHLWDAWTGCLICSYHSYDHLDQVVAAYCVGFNEDGSQLLCGFNKCIRVFDTNRPGRYFSKIESAWVAWNKLCLYNLNGNNHFCQLEGCPSGVTHVQFSADGTKLFSGTRKNNEIWCWDMRNPGKLLCAYEREVSTNQRIYFDLEPQHSRFLISGNTKGEVLKWDLEEHGINETTKYGYTHIVHQPSSSFTAHRDCTNGISINPYCPIIATSSGQRHFPEPVSEYESDSSSESDVPKPLFTRQKIVRESTVKLWWIRGF
ncbi:telomerase Cajal body protein 1-like [Homarus americanus]|uniref:WD repeat-containing protein 79 n=1 Tax=Homarus americanus TaxID=6706 RepID=A0A8J5KG78_HOMAM|nr:telomerase Cajal body protein 1-like [Homarus americanus]